VAFSVAARVLGCLKGIATGDAIGRQTETLSFQDVMRWYPEGVRGFEGSAGEVIPRYRGNRKREWRFGETTDDTERTVAVARAILNSHAVSHERIGVELLACTKCVHPGVASLWEFHEAADPRRVATRHDGCGAAIRVAPVGIFYSSQRLEELVDGAREASISTHGGPLAIAGAAATAAAVSAAIDAASPREVADAAVRAAVLAEYRWFNLRPPVFAPAIRAVRDSLGSLPALNAEDVASRWFPNQPMSIVPLALALATRMTSAEDAILLAANIGGDSDSVASIAGGILGAMYPATINDGWFRDVEQVNAHNLTSLAEQLGALRN
jgi:ADP-ribosylglycohydrolase